MNIEPAAEEEALRAGLDTLARQGAEPVLDTGELLGRARQARRLRTTAFAGAGAVLIVGCASVAVPLASSGSESKTSTIASAPSQDPVTSSSGVPQVPAVTWTPDPTAAKGGPDAPQIGVSYPFDLLTHCGIHWAAFGGKTWATDTQLPEPRPKPDPKTGVTTYTGYTAGFMTLLAPGTLRFDAPGGVSAVFHPTSAPIGLCA
jgi:hypothetical protein